MTSTILDKKVINAIGRSIKEGKYLSITYKNQNNEISDFWICVLDMDANDHLYVNMFNVTKPEPILNAKIKISRITKAEILRFSYYDVPSNLIHKLNSDPSLESYPFEHYDARILNYYLACYRSNVDPFLYKQHLIPEIDINSFIKQNPLHLSEIQLNQIIKDIYFDKYEQNSEYELAISEFSIDLFGKGKFVVAYRKLQFDPVQKTLKLGTETWFNNNFYIQQNKYSLSYYSEMTQQDFETAYRENKNETIGLLQHNFNRGELPNTRPEIIVLGYSQIDISDIYENINIDYTNKKLELPVKALFQQLSSLDRKNRTNPNLVLFDKNVNIDQLRTIYNALKFPITYVQGPPGTGKTQTILNIVVNCFTSNKTLLISSNNNVPIDGILKKLDLGKYGNKTILFPILRLGNKDYTIEALHKIKTWFEFETTDIPKEEMLSRLKEQSKQKNKLLDTNLTNLEKKLEWEQNLEFVNSLLSTGSNELLIKEKRKIESKISEIPKIQEDLIEIFECIKGNSQLEQFFYFESLKHVKRLRFKTYESLIKIVYLEDLGERVKQFNKWLRDDENLALLLKVFPIILTTNLSSKKLGFQHKFDLLVMDEAGQCDIATSIVPISKCKNLVLIGDTNQLKPIINTEETINNQLMLEHYIPNEYNYLKNSILSLYKQIDHISQNILLRYHYRCGKKIINYSNRRFYENKLKLDKIKSEGEIKLLNVSNLNAAGKNSNIEEALEITAFIKTNQLEDVFILTPFRNQKAVIETILQNEIQQGNIADSVKCGTIHQVQGQENKTIILSTSISNTTNQRTYDWIKNNSQLINVGVTRAKEKLIIAADLKAIDTLSRKEDDLYALVQYVKNNGNLEVAESNVNRFTVGFSNDSRFENEFYKTMQHYCSINASRFERNVKLIQLFPKLLEDKQYKNKEFDGVLYEAQSPKIVFEIDGSEHYTKRNVIQNDQVKADLLKTKEIKLIRIPNQYVKHYEYISNLIGKFNGSGYQTSLFDYE